jgi:hypothetical protein
VFFDLPFEMKFELIIELLFDPPAEEEGTKT